jgi:hypothetical protein
MHANHTRKGKFSIAFLAALAIGCLICTTGSTALAKAKSAKKADQSQTVLGTVKSVDGNALTVETKKGGAKQFQLSDDTKYQLKGKKDSAEQAAARSDVKEGQRVSVTAKGDQVQSIVIETKGKKSKKAT